MSVTSWSIHYEDILLLRALNGVHHSEGFYIDVGANNPNEDSVTKLFYDHGWRGINIEPSPYWYNRLSNERPRDINIQAAATDFNGTIVLYDHPDGGLGTINEAFADRHEKQYNIEKVKIDVPAIPLSDICAKHCNGDVHFLKIDVEGHEEQVLRGMDFDACRPWILCIEATEPLRVDVLTHESWDPIVVGAGYKYVHFDGLNRWYVAEERPERMAAFQFGVDNYVHWTYLRRIAVLEAQLQAVRAAIS